MATRPKFFFRPDGKLPELVTVKLARPHGFVSHAQAQWNDLVTSRVREVEAGHRERRQAAGKTVLGREAILKQSPFDSPKSPEPHFGMSPRIAAKNKWPRIEAIARTKVFVERHRAAIKQWMAGVASVVFPYGTYWMHKFARVACETADETQQALASDRSAPLVA